MTMDIDSQAEQTSVHDPEPESPSEAESATRRSERKRIPSFKLRSALIAKARDIIEPLSYKEALKSIYATQWLQATKEEKESLDENKTWVLVDESQASGKSIIGCKWVYKLKRNADGSTRFKARLVIKGYKQVHGIDYDETFAPVAKFVTLRLLLALAALKDWEIEHMDIKTAFLNPTLDKEVYMEQPEGFEIPSSSRGRLICQLKKLLYSLKQAPRA